MAKKVLVVDDEEIVCKIFSEILEQDGYRVFLETSGNQVMDRLWDEGFDLVLLDLVMPNINGIDLLRRIKQCFDDLPVIIVTSHSSVETAVDSMLAGASDFVTKPVEASVLQIRVRKTLEHAHTKRLAYTDGLTDLYNYRSFQERIEQEVGRANRYYRFLSLIMIDIDHFKLYNDAHGHPRGDNVLVEVADSLRYLTRASDIVARYGGEEFALILPETDGESAEALGHRLREYVEQRSFFGEEELPGKTLTVSVGIASHHPPNPRERLIEAADAAMYQAKREGRNRVVVWNPQTVPVRS